MADKECWKRNLNNNKITKGEAYMVRTYEKGTSRYEFIVKPMKVLYIWRKI